MYCCYIIKKSLKKKKKRKKGREEKIPVVRHTVVSSSIFSLYFNITNIYEAILVGLVIGLFTVFGDLFESYLKRINNKKDSSKLIPGHGGILDRLDGFLFAIVIMFIFMLWSNH